MLHSSHGKEGQIKTPGQSWVQHPTPHPTPPQHTYPTKRPPAFTLHGFRHLPSSNTPPEVILLTSPNPDVARATMRLISCYDSPTSQQLTCQFHVGLRLPVAAIRVPCGGCQSCTGGAVQPPPHSRWEHRGPMRRRRAGEWGVARDSDKAGGMPGH